MKRNKLLFLFYFISLGLFAQAPDWSVNASNYQYNMTVTAFLNVNGTTLTNQNDKLGAFVNDEKRGEAKVVFNANANKYLVYLTIYANTNGETINFKIYDSTNNQIVDIDKTVTFSINANYGGVFQSESFANPALSKNAAFLNFNFKNITEVSSVISNDEILILLPQNTLVNNLIPEFTTTNNAKVFINQKTQSSGVETIDFTNDVLYQVLSEDESVLKTYTVKVSVSTNENKITAVLSPPVNDFVKDKLFTVNLSFSNEILSLTADDFLISNGFIKEINSQDNQNFSIELIALNQGGVSLQLAENVVFDSQNNSNNASNTYTTTFDNESPILTEVILEGTDFLITFSEDIKNVSLSNFSLAGLAKQGFEITEIIKVSNSKYIVKLNDLQTHVGNLYPVILAGTIQDFAGNLLETQNFEQFLKSKTLSTYNYLDADFFIYPNPTNNFVSLKIGNHSIKKIILYNLLGQEIKSIFLNNLQEVKFDISDVSKSTYFLQIITNDDKRYLKRIIKN